MVRPGGHGAAAAPLLQHADCLRCCRLLENSPVLLSPSEQPCSYFLQGAQQLSKQLSRKDSPGGSSLLRWEGVRELCTPVVFLDKHPHCS